MNRTILPVGQPKPNTPVFTKPSLPNPNGGGSSPLPSFAIPGASGNSLLQTGNLNAGQQTPSLLQTGSPFPNQSPAPKQMPNWNPPRKGMD